MKKKLLYAVSRGLTVGLLVITAGSSLFGQIALTMTSSEPNPVGRSVFLVLSTWAAN
jgi:hypothetical protein